LWHLLPICIYDNTIADATDTMGLERATFTSGAAVLEPIAQQGNGSQKTWHKSFVKDRKWWREIPRPFE
jgi:hypothetical protein